MAIKRTPFKTAVGIAKYCYLQKMDEKYDPIYKTTLALDKEAAQPLIELINKTFIAENGEENIGKATMPFTKTDDGVIEFKFKSKLKPKLWDTQNNPITEDLNMRTGSKIQVQGTMQAWNAGGKVGTTLYVNNVKVISVETGGGGSPFDKDDGIEGFVVANSNTPGDANANQADF